MESEKLQQQDYIKCTIIQGAPTHNLFPGILRKENYICRFKRKENVIQKNMRRMTMKVDVFYLNEYVTETKCKKYNRRIYTLYSDMGNTDLHRYVLVHFQIDVNYK